MASYWCTLDYSQPPEALHRCSRDFGDPSAPTYPAKTPYSNFLKGVKWSPDGACLATAADDSTLRIFDLPPDSLTAPPLSETPETSDPESDTLTPEVRIDTGECIYDYAWHPRMASNDPSTCLLASASRAQPVHMWDPVTGALRGSYRSYNAVDEVEAAYGLAFSPDGSKLYCGHERYARIFDVERPGRHYSKTIYTYQKHKEHSIQGIVSCFALSPAAAGMPDPWLAIGTYQGAAGIYDAGSDQLVLILKGHRGGLTQLMFSRCGYYLYTGARRDGDLLCWDVRYAQQEVYRVHRRTSTTNQRIQFDIEPYGRYLATGEEGGHVSVFSLSDGSKAHEYQCGTDTINGFAFHPTAPFAATASGQRRYPLGGDEGEEGSSSGEDMEDSAPGPAGAVTRREGSGNELRVWRFAHTWSSSGGEAAEGAEGLLLQASAMAELGPGQDDGG